MCSYVPPCTHMGKRATNVGTLCEELGLPRELRRSLACTNIIENVMGTVRRVCRNVKHWHPPSMAMRWTAAAMMEAKKGFRRLKAHKQLPALRAALDKQGPETSPERPLVQIAEAA